MYEVRLEPPAEKALNKLDDSDAKRITKKLRELETNPHLGKPLIGNLTGQWRLRIGKYRVIYKIIENKLLILILDLGLRKNVYK